MSNKEIIIKGKTIGKGKPLICVPVMERGRSEIVERVAAFAQENADMIEWRIDAFEEVSNVEAVKLVLDEIKEVIGNSILVYTYRSKIQGGLGEDSIEKIYELQCAGAQSGVVDIVDVELFASEDSKKQIKKLQKQGVRVIASHHDFNQTPDEEVVETILENLWESGTDIVKLAVMPNSFGDVLTIMKETLAFREEYPDTPIITMSMGAIGSISRVAGEYYGSCVTFGAGNAASAPGQLPKDKLKYILDTLHESIGE